MERRLFLAMTAVGAMHTAAASDRIRVGLIGCGERGRYLAALLPKPDVELAGVCDVYEPNLARGQELAGGAARACVDYRELLDDPSIDAVIIATPDHWHPRMLIDSVEAGKDVYLEKPIALHVDDGFEMVAAVRRNHRVVQVGTQRRSNSMFHEAAGVVQSGALGTVHLVTAWWYNNVTSLDRTPLTGKLNWKQWLGPAPYRPFDPMRFRNWYYFRDYSGGMVCNAGCHIIDAIQMSMRSTFPDAVTCSAGLPHIEGAERLDTAAVTIEFPGDYLVVFTCSFNAMHYAFARDQLKQFHGHRARLDVGREDYALYPQTNEKELKASLAKSAPGTFEPSSRLHVLNFLECVRSRNNPNATIEMGNYTSIVLAMAIESLNTGRRIRWDRQARRMI
jgi:predicted dehydrogenase